MSNRANYILIENGITQLYYSKYGADTLGYRLIDGVNKIVETTRRFELVRELMEDGYAEGAMILNLDKQEILFFDDLLGIESTFLKPIIFKMLMETLYVGWSIKWAMMGMLDIAEYLGEKEHRVVRLEDVQLSKPKVVAIKPEHSRISNLFFIKVSGKILCYYLPYLAHSILSMVRSELEEFLSNFEQSDYSNLNRSNISEFIFIDDNLQVLNLYFSRPLFVRKITKALELWRGWKINYISKGYE